ncbi:MAG: diguanylate cyclase, partial [Candidatus Hydrogenedentes bacterium]|nr:diguanylate cyclase [Candidatus Hydrogenedentota bacterium]
MEKGKENVRVNYSEMLGEVINQQTCDIIKNLDIGAYVVSTDRSILLWNEKSREITGYYPEEVEGSHCQDNILKHVDDNGTELCLSECPLAKTLKDGKVRRAKVYLRHKLGYRLPVRVEVVPLLSDGEIKGAVEFFMEDTEEINLLEELREAREKALVCALTEVGNRRFAEQVIEDRLAEMKRLKSSMGLFFIDIDDFKKVNDTYGHPIGDLVLKMV